MAEKQLTANLQSKEDCLIVRQITWKRDISASVTKFIFYTMPNDTMCPQEDVICSCLVGKSL